MRGGRGQISVEHLFIVLLSMAILIPGTLLFYEFSKNSNHSMISNQVVRVGDEITRNAEIVHYLGTGSRLRMNLIIPKSVTSIDVSTDGAELLINFTSYTGANSAVFFPNVKIIGPYGGGILPAFHNGRTVLVFENDHDVVTIKEAA